MKGFEKIYKETRIGKIPKDWPVLKLDNIIDIETGKRAKGGALSKGEVISLGGEHINKDRGIMWYNKTKFIPLEFYKELKQGKVTPSDILLVKDGATTGKVAFVHYLPYKNVATNEHVFIIRVKETDILFNKFLFYILFSGIGQQQIKLNFHGMIGGIKREDVKFISIPLPPLPEQKKIAEILGTVDKAIQKVDEAIEKTERLKKGLMQELLTKGIGHKEFKDTEIGRIPKEWEVVRLEEAGEIITGKTPSTSHDKFWNGNISFITPGDIEDFKYLYSTERYVTLEGAKQVGKILPKDSVLTVCIGSTIGKTALTFTDSITNQQINALICKEGIEEQYVYYSLSFKENLLKLYAGVAAVPIVKKSLFERIKISLPSLMEQHKIAEILSSVDKKLETLHHQKGKYEKIKKGLMQDLLTGKRRVEA